MNRSPAPTARSRKEVLMGEEEAAALIKDGDVVIVGGFGTVNHPMPIIRALIRRKVKNLTVIGAATAGLELDLLIGAGCVKKVIAPYIGAELHAPVGNCYPLCRRERRDRGLRDHRISALFASSMRRRAGSASCRGAAASAPSLPVLNKDYVPFNDPINGEPYLAVPALHADWAIIHVGQADVYGNGQHGGARFGDRLLSRAAERVMLTAERIVPNSEIRKNPFNDLGGLCRCRG